MANKAETDIEPISTLVKFKSHYVQKTVRKNGFSLLELLVVLVIISVLAGVVTITMAGKGEARQIQTVSERLMLAIELARVRSSSQNRWYGVTITSHSYTFLHINDETKKWSEVIERPLQRVDIGTQHSMQLYLEGSGSISKILRGTKDGIKPSIVIFPNGELSSFQIVVSPTISTTVPIWNIVSNGYSRTTAFKEPTKRNPW